MLAKGSIVLKFSWLFLIWYAIGFILMVFFEVPPWLEFSNGIFLVLYALSLMEVAVRADYENKRRIAAGAAAVAAVTFTVEYIGIKTGYPFGEYFYYPTLGPLILGVPFTIALAWVGVILNSMLLSSAKTRWMRALGTAFWVILLDLILDPVAAVREFWFWEKPGAFYGIPLENFISWGLIAALCSLFFPLGPVPLRSLRQASRLFQAMLLLFGTLALKEGLSGIFVLSLVFMAVCEGRYRYDRGQNQQPV